MAAFGPMALGAEAVVAHPFGVLLARLAHKCRWSVVGVLRDQVVHSWEALADGREEHRRSC